MMLVDDDLRSGHRLKSGRWFESIMFIYQPVIIWFSSHWSSVYISWIIFLRCHSWGRLGR